jgi:hypothetical protein
VHQVWAIARVRTREVGAKAKSEFLQSSTLVFGVKSSCNYSFFAETDRFCYHSHKESVKRQRTNSHSSSTPSLTRSTAVPASSSDEALAIKRDHETSPKRIRGAAAKNHREKELREQRERERLDAATRRKVRSERRRGDGKLESSSSSDPQSVRQN